MTLLCFNSWMSYLVLSLKYPKHVFAKLQTVVKNEYFPSRTQTTMENEKLTT